MVNTVEIGDIREAMRLISASKSSINTEDNNVPQTISEKIYNLVHGLSAEKKQREVDMADVIERCSALGYTNDNIEEAIEEFESNNMWHVNSARTKIIFV